MQADSLMATYARLPIDFVRGEGCYLFDSEGKRYFDAITGIGVCSLGHCHPRVTEAICSQAGTLLHAANLAGIPLQRTLADRLCERTGMERAFFCNSGAEAVEAAMKIGRAYGVEKGITAPRMLVVSSSFHGRTLGAVSATDSDKVRAGFGTLLADFVRIPFNDLAAIDTISEPATISAVLIEPILGEGGVVPASPSYLQALRAACNKHDWLLIADEVQTGMGKTGSWLASSDAQITPDVVCLAKALGNGVPIGACLAQGAAADVLTVGRHGSTYGGNPLACTAALAVIETIEEHNLLAAARSLGERLRTRLLAQLGDSPEVTEIRGRGLMLGVEFAQPPTGLRDQLLGDGFIVNVTRDRVLRLLPPLIASEHEIDTLADAITERAKCGSKSRRSTTHA